MEAEARPAPRGFDKTYWAGYLDQMDAIAADVALTPQLLALEMSFLHIAATDPDLYAVVQLALTDLPPDRGDPQPTVTAAASPRRQPRNFNKLIISNELLAEIRQHAEDTKAGYEIVGRIVVGADGRARRYDRLRNEATSPNRFRYRASWRPEPDQWALIVHSHPRGGRMPSRLDRAHARARRTIGIWHNPTDTLGVFTLGADDAYAEVPVVQPTPLVRRGFLIDLDERLVYDRHNNIVAGGYPAYERFRTASGW